MDKLTNKIIIRNYTNLDDFKVILKIATIINEGKISETKSQGKQYCFVTSFQDSIITCNKKNNTYTFYVQNKGEIINENKKC